MLFDLLLYASSSLKLTLYLLTYWIVSVTVYLYFYLLIFDIRRIFDVLQSSSSAPTPFFIKTGKVSASKCSYYILIPMKHSLLLTAKVTTMIILCYLYKSYIYNISLFCKQIFKRNINDCNEIFYVWTSYPQNVLNLLLFFTNFTQFLCSDNVFTVAVVAVQRFYVGSSGC